MRRFIRVSVVVAISIFLITACSITPAPEEQPGEASEDRPPAEPIDEAPADELPPPTDVGQPPQLGESASAAGQPGTQQPPDVSEQPAGESETGQPAEAAPTDEPTPAATQPPKASGQTASQPPATEPTAEPDQSEPPPPTDEPTPTAEPDKPPVQVDPGEGVLTADVNPPRAADGAQQVPGLIRSRYVRINLPKMAAAAPDAQGQGGGVPFVLNLFDDVVLVATIERTEVNPSGSLSWFASVDSDAFGEAIFIVNPDEGRLIGSIATRFSHYVIGYVGDGVHVVQEVDPSVAPNDAPPLVPPLEDSFADAMPPTAADQPPVAGDGGPYIDVMIVYTPEAAAAAANYNPPYTMQDLANMAIAQANQSYVNSDVNQRLRLVDLRQVTYTEQSGTNGWNNMLNDLTDDDGGIGPLDEVHGWRDAAGADLVSLLVDDMTYCGLAWVMQTVSTSFASHGFSIVSWACIAPYQTYSFHHELGHNMGSAHDRDHASVYGAYTYSYGYWYWASASQNFRTVMSYDCTNGCLRVNYWSNPDIIDPVRGTGQPMGIPIGQTNEADNRTSLNNTAPTVAAFRTFSFSCLNVSEIPQPECEALEAFYESTNGPAWNNHTNWIDTLTPCTNWYGVTCSGDHVTEINLAANDLGGSIPSEIEDLPYLTDLDLSGNWLSGNIPDLSALTSLATLDLSNNALSGDVPNSTLPGGLVANLDYNALTDPVGTDWDTAAPNWQDTQTVAPDNLQAATVDPSTAELTWDPILYTNPAHGGYFEVSYATKPGGPYTVHGTITDKTASGYMANDLYPDKTYYFIVRTYTPAHDVQQNDLWSEFTGEASAATLPIISPAKVGEVTAEGSSSGPPYQIELHITGYYGDGCHSRTIIEQEIIETSPGVFDVILTIYRKLPPDKACSAKVKPIDLTITLDDLDAGTYNITVNGYELSAVIVP